MILDRIFALLKFCSAYYKIFNVREVELNWFTFVDIYFQKKSYDTRLQSF